MIRSLTIISFLIAIFLVPSPSNAQQFYISTELGIGIGNSLNTYSSDNDFPTLCDKYLDPDNLFSPVGVTEPEGCPPGDSWNNSFDGSTGITAGAALGLRTDFGPRIEAEYFYVGLQYNMTSPLSAGGATIEDKSQQELIRSEERIGGVAINSFFVNAYYDLPVSGKLRPYAGGGVGFGMVEVEYDCVFARNLDPDAIKTADGATYNGNGNEAADRAALHERIAGTTSTASETLEDTVFGYQVVIGVDYMLTDRTSMGLKGRWVKYGKFSNGEKWDQLRGHAPNNGEGTDTVVYTVETDDLSAFGISLVMKYTF